ncbi:MAG TPA: hypothetical protein VJO34_07900 [Methylomirabilota bacterium]|nr:hypothetical protein [Methylomirabilota bacterium]
MDELFLLILLGLTSVGAYLIGKRRGLSWSEFHRAVGSMLESVGFSLVFFLINLGLGVSLILAIRALTPWFVSLYLADNAVLLILSFLQGLTFQWWRATSAREEGGQGIPR